MLEMIKKADGHSDPQLIHLRRRRTVRTVSVCDVGFIFYKDMIPLMSDYPDLDYRIRRQSRLRLMNEQRQKQKYDPSFDPSKQNNQNLGAAQEPIKILKEVPLADRMKTIED